MRTRMASFNKKQSNKRKRFLYCSIIQAIIVPFSTVVRKYAIRFFYDNGVAPGSFNKWVELINLITQGQWFRDKLQYYINLETDLP